VQAGGIDRVVTYDELPRPRLPARQAVLMTSMMDRGRFLLSSLAPALGAPLAAMERAGKV
jgi:hypothetical protein